jgi:hypothetical protein
MKKEIVRSPSDRATDKLPKQGGGERRTPDGGEPSRPSRFRWFPVMLLALEPLQKVSDFVRMVFNHLVPA